MSEFSPATYPEVFVSHTAISDAVYAAVGRGELRKIGSRLYTRNLTEDPERLSAGTGITSSPATTPMR